MLTEAEAYILYKKLSLKIPGHIPCDEGTIIEKIIGEFIEKPKIQVGDVYEDGAGRFHQVSSVDYHKKIFYTFGHVTEGYDFSGKRRDNWNDTHNLDLSKKYKLLEVDDE